MVLVVPIRSLLVGADLVWSFPSRRVGCRISHVVAIEVARDVPFSEGVNHDVAGGCYC